MPDTRHDSNQAASGRSQREVQIRVVSHKDAGGERSSRVAALLAEAIRRTCQRLD